MVAESRRKPSRSRRVSRTKCVVLIILVAIFIVGIQNALWGTVDWNMTSGLPDGTNPSRSGNALSEKKKKKRVAYAFYATTSAYACGVFVQVAQLRDLGTPASIDFVLLTYGEASTNLGIAEQAAKMNVILKVVEHLPILGGKDVGKGSRGRSGVQHNSYYTNVMVKLRVFELYEYDRIVYMDADMMVRQNLDHLFDDEVLPYSTTTLAAAKVTNRKNTDPLRFCSCFMVLQPSRTLWNRIVQYYNQSNPVSSGPMYDMDLLNHEFQKDIRLLPGSYGLLTAIWDNHDMTNHKIGVDAPGDEATRQWYQSILLQGSSTNEVPSESHFSRPIQVKSRQDLFQAGMVLHFTPNKPMVERNMVNIQRNQPHADPQYYATFEKWYSLASYVCSSFDSQPSNLHKYDKHRTHKFERTNQYSDYFN